MNELIEEYIAQINKLNKQIELLNEIDQSSTLSSNVIKQFKAFNQPYQDLNEIFTKCGRSIPDLKAQEEELANAFDKIASNHSAFQQLYEETKANHLKNTKYISTGISKIVENTENDLRKLDIFFQKESITLPDETTLKEAFKTAGIDVDTTIKKQRTLDEFNALIKEAFKPAYGVYFSHLIKELRKPFKKFLDQEQDAENQTLLSDILDEIDAVGTKENDAIANDITTLYQKLSKNNTEVVHSDYGSKLTDPIGKKINELLKISKSIEKCQTLEYSNKKRIEIFKKAIDKAAPILKTRRGDSIFAKFCHAMEFCLKKLGLLAKEEELEIFVDGAGFAKSSYGFFNQASKQLIESPAPQAEKATFEV